MDKVLNNLLIQRLKYLIGKDGILNPRIIGNSIFFDTEYGKDIEDYRYDINYFYVVGSEGEEKVDLTDDNYFQKIQRLKKELK